MQTITQRQLETVAPGAPSTLVELLRERAQQRSFEPLYNFLSDGETQEVTLTYGELEERARAIAWRLQFIGAESERVLLLFPPGLDYIAAFFGCLYAGAIAVPAYPPRLNKKLDRLQAIIADAGVSVILTTSSVRQKAQPLFAQSEQLKAVRWLAVDEINLDLASYWEEPAIGADSIAFIQYTSGSTSIPKGVMVTHGNLLHNEAMIKDTFRQSEQSIIVGWLPLYHDMGLIGNVLQPLYLGARCILMSPVAFLQRPFRWLSAISRYRATTSGGPNFAYELCLRKISPEQRASLDLSSWEVAFNGAEPIRAATQKSFAETFAACGFRREAFQPCYGLAEATLLVTGKHNSELAAVKGFEQRALEQNVLREVPPEDEQACVLVSNGATLSDQQVRIVNPETLTECAPDKVGEVWVSGSSVTRGYWNRPEETRKTFGAYLADTGEGPFLRTGDMGFLRDAELFITGRLKDLVIIRGLNHYPQDIELTAERSCAALRPGCGVAFSVEVEGEEQLVIVYEIERHAELDIAEAAAAIREAVAEQHEVQVYAVSLIQTGTIPKTSSGKLQRRACRDKFLAGTLEVVAEWRGTISETSQTETSASAPQTVDDIAAWLTSQLAARAGVAVSEVDVNQSFAHYGVDSLAAIEMAHEVETRLGNCVSIASFLESTSILQFASSLCNLSDLCDSVIDESRITTHHRDTENTEVAQSKAEPVAIKDHALSYGQRSLWFLHRMEPSSAAYNIANAVRIRSPLDVRALRAALQTLMTRHASLRTTFTSQQGEPIQRVHDFMEICFTEEDAAGWDEGVLNERLIEAAYRPFDLEHGPLLRVSLFKKSETESVLLLAVHHIVTDFWSLAILVQELGVLYRADEQSALPIAGQFYTEAYTEYARWQSSMLDGPEGERLWSYWKQQLSGELPAVNLPTDHPRPVKQTYNGASVPFKLNAELTTALQELSKTNDATLYMTLLAAFQVLLSRYTGQTNFAVGSPTAGRRAAGWASTVGYFVNPVVMRAELSGDPTFADYLKRVRRETLAALAHLDFPFPLLVERLQPERDLSRSPLFQAMFVLQKSHQASDARFAELASGESHVKLEVGGLSLESIAIPQRVAQFDLTLMMAEAEGGMAASFIYNTDLFDAATISRLAGHFRTLLEGIVRNPERRVAKLPLLTGNERRQLLIEWNKTAAVDWGVDEYAVSADLLHEGFEAQAARTPHDIALIAGEERLTYAELDTRSNQLAHHLISLGVTTESRVGLLTERNAEMVIAILAVLKAGAAYVPLDPQYPQERIAFMLADSGAKVLLTQAHLAERLTAQHVHTVMLDTEQAVISSQPTHSPFVRMEKVNLGYVIYTSGSTGRPKGVAIEHQSAVEMLDWAHHTFRRADLQGVLFATSICFDLSIFELFVPLWCGGTVILAHNALQLPLLAARSDVTLINTVPSAMSELIHSASIPESVRVVNLAGEPLTTRLAADVYSAARVEQLWNLYGPTEDTTYSTFLLVEPRQQRMTIGRPVKGTQAYVLDQSLQPVPVGVSGELYLGGAGLARGYLARPELTAERFIPDPFSAARGARIYRTGDLVRYHANGEIEYLGRIDHQVKVRGFRIELGEVEAVLRQQEQVQEAVVVARADRLVAYVVANRSRDLLSAPELWTWLRERLPQYMVPSAIVVLPELPLTPNGKIDRKRLPDPEQTSSAEQSGLIEPRTQTEEMVRGIWQEVLKKRELSVESNFFSIGGHSLLATQVLSRVKQMFQVDISLSAIFERPTIAALAALLEESQTLPQLDKTPTLTNRKDRRDPFHLSYAQQRLWFLNYLEPDSPFYNMATAVRLKGSLDTTALEAALGEVVRRHEALRTVFTLKDEEPVQVVLSNIKPEMPVHDLRHLTGVTVEAEVRRFFDEESQRPFDLSQGPLLRVTLLRLSETEHVALLVVHHIVSDGWSMGVLVREVASLYEAFTTGQSSPLEELAVQYADFAEWQREWLTGDLLEEQLKYWRGQLAGADTSLEMPTARARPARQTYRGAELPVTLSPELTAALGELGGAHGATMFMTLLAAFQVLLHRYTNQDDVLVGTPIANRNRAEIEGLIGFFVNTLVLRADLSGDPTFRQLLERARAVSLGAYAHQDLPFEKLVEELQPERSLSRNPLFQVMFALQNAPAGELALRGLTLNVEEFSSSFTRFDLELHLREQEGGLRGRLIYSTDLFDETTMRRLLSHFETLLEGIVRRPDERISRLSLLSEDEARQIIYKWNQETADFPRDLCLHELFAQQVERTPDKIAVEFEGVTASYAELNQRADQLARYLQQRGVGPDVPVGIMMQRSIEMTVAVLGILKAGGAYLPLDPEYPQERLSFMLEDSGAHVLLTDAKTVSRFPHARVHEVIRVDADWDDIATEQGERLAGAGATPLNLAYVIYTSGSTGQPKGVGMTHRPLVNLIAWQLARSAWAGRPLRTLQFTSLSFDVSCQELFSTWLSGATLVLVGEEVRRDSRELLRVLVQERVERLFQPFIALQYLAETADQDGIVPQHLREVITAGEQLKITRPIRNLFTRLNGCRLDNQYGPTEAHVVSSFMLDGPASEWPELPPIGRPVANVQLYVLDECMQPVPAGVPGELFIGGEALARGYIGHAKATAEKFVPHPFDTGDGNSRLYRTGDVARYMADGNIAFLGRRDQLVKVRGYRIEVSEVETALRGFEQVSEAVVVAHDGPRGEKRLVAYVLPRAEVTMSELRTLLKEKLPEYMIPSAFVFVEKWPLTPSGKINRKALPAPELLSDESEHVAPRTTTEEKLAGIWSRLLGVERFGIHDNFFNLGGHSLLATQLMSRVRVAFDIELPLRSLFEEPTIEGFAQTVERELRAHGTARRGAPPLRPMPRDGDLPLSFAQQRMWFIDRLGLGGTAYSLAGAIRLTGALDVRALAQSLNEVIRRHEMLRITFNVVDGEPVQVINPFQPIALPAVDLRELPEAAREAEVGRQFAEEVQKPFDLAHGPLMRLSLLQTSEQEHVLIVNMHHIISDGWSMRVLVNEVATLYAAFMNGAPSPLAELPVQYADYAQWQRQWLQGEVLDEQLNYWRQQLKGASPVLDLPTDRPRPAIQSWRGAKQPLAISAALTAQLQALARREGVTLYMLLLAAFQTLLYRYTGQRDICVGSPVAGRHELETESLIGLFINMLVMRGRLDSDASFRQLLEQARTTALEAYAHQDVPFEKLVEELQSDRDLSHAPLFQVMFVLHNAPPGAVRLPGLSLEPIESDAGTARYDLTLELSERADSLEGWFEYNTDLFDASTVERMCEHLLTLLAALAENLSLRLSELPILNTHERRRMLVEWNNTAIDYSADKPVHQFFEEQAARTPGRTAVIFEDAELSYGELNRRANQQAHHLSAMGVKPGDRVAIAIERSLDLMVGLLGILKAGAAYVPLDPSYPRERLAFMLADAEVTALLTQRRLLTQLPEQDAPVICIDADWSAIAQQQETNPAIHLAPEHLAYIIYTSGSTGKPKGVMVTHANLSNFLTGMDQRLLDKESEAEAGTWLAVTSISFDISVLELFWTLARGWRVVIQSDSKQNAIVSSIAADSETASRPMDFSLFYFASSESAAVQDKYRLLIEGARFADENGFTAVWTPERHFHAFGGLYPNPSVISASLALITKNVALRAGSVVLPLHPAIRVAEEWAVVDNLSGGRVGVSFASGWHANDFVLAPESYGERQKLMYERIEEVRRLWRGKALTLRDGAGTETEIRTLPRPVQEELPVWVTAAGSVETFRSAGKIGAGLLTHLLGQSVEDLDEKIAAYREARREAGHEGEGHVSLMLHTYVGEEMDEVREVVRGPFCDYLMESVGLARNLTRSLGYDLEIESLSHDELKSILTRGFDRYFETSGLMGTPESCLRMINRLKATGVDEVACLIDFGVAADDVMKSLKHLNELRELSNPKTAEIDSSIPAQIARYGVTHLQCTPSMARMLLLDATGAAALSSLKKLLVGGEELTAPLAAELAQVVNGEIHNMYGPTETTIWSTTHQITQTHGAVPIGRPIANTETYILDSKLQPVPAGVHGDLFIGGAGVVQGYLKRPELTAERFIPSPFAGQRGARLYRTGDAASYLPDGTIQFWGRTDNQVKLRGYRIELGEIEAVLTEHPAVREAAVVARPAESGEPSLVAYLVAAQASVTEFQARQIAAEAETLLGERSRYTLPNGMTIAHHSSPQTSAIYREIFEDKVYARHGITYNDGDCIFDVGSNIGLFTLFANQMCKNPRIFAFEPIPPTFDILHTNVSLYDLDVKLFELGLADKVDTSSFTFYREASGLSGRTDYAADDKQTTKTVIANWLNRVGADKNLKELDELMDEMMSAETFDCRLSTLSNVIRENGVERIDLLKVDVEGGEVDVLNGIEEADWPRIKQVVLEVDTEDLLREVRLKLETHRFHLAVDKTTTVREGAEYVYTVYATRTPQNGNSNGARPATVLSTTELRSFLKERLPEYMVPSTFVTLDALPLTPNGKVNRFALPAPETGRRGSGVVYEAPRTDAEQKVSEIWREALHVEQVGVNDNFFDLGGNSLLLVKVHSKLQEAFSRNISMVEMFRRATVVSLASYLVGGENGKSALKQTQSRAQKQTVAINTQRELMKQRAQKVMKDRKR